MRQHTQGPWLINDQDLFAIYADKKAVAVAYASKDEERIANARLIAAAPELLKALQELTAIATGRGVNIRKQLDAIAKATGGA